MDCSPPGSSARGDSPLKSTGVGSHALLEGIYPVQASNPGLPHCRQILYHLYHEGSPIIPTEGKEKSAGVSKSSAFLHISQSVPLTLQPHGCSPPGSSAHGVLQARILEQVAISFSRESSRPRNRTQVSCIGRQIRYQLSLLATREALLCPHQFKICHVSHYQYIAICKLAEIPPRDHEFSTSFHVCLDRKASAPNGRNEREHSDEKVVRPGFPPAIGTPDWVSWNTFFYFPLKTFYFVLGYS